MKALFPLIFLFLPACSIPTKTVTVHDFCTLYTPIRFTRDEYIKLSNESAKQILARNETWKKVCK